MYSYSFLFAYSKVNVNATNIDKDGAAENARRERERELMRSNSERDRGSHPRELGRDFNDRDVSLAKYCLRGEVNNENIYSVSRHTTFHDEYFQLGCSINIPTRYEGKTYSGT